MNKQEFISKMAVKMEKTKKESGEILDTMLDIITETLADGGEINMVGFGKFCTVEKAAREGRNPSTGETIQIEAKISPKFKPSKTLKDAVNA